MNVKTNKTSLSNWCTVDRNIVEILHNNAVTEVALLQFHGSFTSQWGNVTWFWIQE